MNSEAMFEEIINRLPVANLKALLDPPGDRTPSLKQRALIEARIALLEGRTVPKDPADYWRRRFIELYEKIGTGLTVDEMSAREHLILELFSDIYEDAVKPYKEAAHDHDT